MKKEDMDYPKSLKVRVTDEMFSAFKARYKDRPDGLSGRIRELIASDLGVVDSGRPAPAKPKPAQKPQSIDPVEREERLHQLNSEIGVVGRTLRESGKKPGDPWYDKLLADGKVKITERDAIKKWLAETQEVLDG